MTSVKRAISQSTGHEMYRRYDNLTVNVRVMRSEFNGEAVPAHAEPATSPDHSHVPDAGPSTVKRDQAAKGSLPGPLSRGPIATTSKAVTRIYFGGCHVELEPRRREDRGAVGAEGWSLGRISAAVHFL